jgi:hypothetical protein
VAFTWANDPGVIERRERLLALLREADAHRETARARPGRAVVALRLAESFRDLAPSDGPTSAAGTRNALAGLLDVALEHYRDRLLRAAGAPSAVTAAIDGDRQPAEPETFLRAIDTVLDSQQFLERNVAPQLVLERMFARLIGDARS